MRPSGNPVVFERRRRRAIELLRDGMKPVEVARLLGVGRRSVRRWNATCRRHGIAALSARPNTGRPYKLSVVHRQQLRGLLITGAQACGFATDLWTCPRVAHVVQRRFGVRYHVDHVGRLLRTLGFTPQKPQRKALERDEKAIRNWRYRRWARIKKKPGD